MTSSILKDFKQQLCLPTESEEGRFEVKHPSLFGWVTQYQIEPGLSILLLDCRANDVMALDWTNHESACFVLIFSQFESEKDGMPKFHWSVNANAIRLSPDEHCRQHIIVLDQGWLIENLDNNTQPERVEQQVSQLLADDPLMVALLQWEVEHFWELYPQQALQFVFVKKQLYALLWRLFAKALPGLKPTSGISEQALADQQRIRLIQLYLVAQLQTPLAVDKLAQMAHMSLTKFNRLFKAQTGVSVTEFIAQKRLEVAHDLLMTRQYTVGQVALKVGFSNASGLTKLYQKKFGITPTSIYH